MLLLLNKYMREHKRASLHELSEVFGLRIQVMKDRLSYWIKKGVIRLENIGCQKKCGSCCPEAAEIYSWIEQTQRDNLINIKSL